ncbi:hypothetical protein EON63_20535 [archaeon]|nr:MAG: hypothetical protein EON63_20535 [archaeon]
MYAYTPVDSIRHVCVCICAHRKAKREGKPEDFYITLAAQQRPSKQVSEGIVMVMGTGMGMGHCDLGICRNSVWNNMMGVGLYVIMIKV